MLGIYVHLPFCRVHCAYCPFVVSTDLLLQAAYVDALVTEIEGRAGGEGVDTIFFGGGTPSRTAPQHLQRIAGAIGERFSVDPAAESTIEANPEDVTPEAIASWRSLGVNRLSIGVQSFDDRELEAIGRIHGAARARQAIADAIASGLRTSIDLILGLPNQTADSFRSSLDEAIGSGIGHLSVYMLDLDEDTALKRRVESGLVRLPDEEIISTLYIEMVSTLQRAGFAQYEISNFAREGEESKHNLRYWHRRHYFGFGVGAHSFIGERRFANTRDIRRYIEGAGREFTEELTEIEQRHELVFLRLRQTSGIHYDDLLQLCGEEAVGWIELGVNEGWLRRDGSRVAFTPAGFLVSSELISQLF
ncbi:MAG TPA: radical SAM family heme chaperone HemW [Thermoanaerobaculia bacterium]